MMKRILMGLMVLALALPAVALEQREITTKTLTIDISKDGYRTETFDFYGGTLGLKFPVHDSCYFTIETLESDMPAGSVPLFSGFTIDDYVLMQYMADNAGNTSVADHSGEGHTFTSTVNTSSLTAAGYDGLGFSFNGSSEYMTLSDDPDFDFAADTSFVVGFWFKQNANNSEELMIRKGNGPGGWHCSMSVNGKVRWLVTSNGSDVDLIHSDTVLDDGLWHLYVGVKEADDYIRLYIDGVQEGVTAISNATGTLENTEDIEIAGPMDIAGQRWTGSLDGLFVVSGKHPLPTTVALHYAEALSALSAGAVAGFSGGVTAIAAVATRTGTAGEYISTDLLENYVGPVRIKASAVQTADREFQVFYTK